MSRSFFAPDGKSPAPPSESVNAPFLNGNGADQDVSMRLPSNTHDVRQDKRAATAPVAPVSALAPILAYCASSIMMTVINKFVLKAHFSLNLIVLLIQSAVGCSLVVLAQSLKWVELRPLNAKDVKLWMPISTLLVFVIWTGSKALQYLSIPVYTIFKNLTIILIAYGEVVWFGGKVTRLTLVSFLLMVFSSVIAAYSDIAHFLVMQNLSMPHTPDSLSGGHINPATLAKSPAFDALSAEKASILAIEQAQNSQDHVLDGLSGWSALNSGYVWMALNCLCSAAYVLAMRKRIKVTGFKDWDTMFYNNLLTIPVLIVMSWLVEDWSSENFARNFPIATRNSIFTAIVFSGACAVFISYTTAWCIRATSSTTYSMVGALNKLPLALSGMVFFGDAVTLSSTSAIGVGFFAGLVYAYAKNKQSEDAKRAAASSSVAPPQHETSIGMQHLNGKEERND